MPACWCGSPGRPAACGGRATRCRRLRCGAGVGGRGRPPDSRRDAGATAFGFGGLDFGEDRNALLCAVFGVSLGFGDAGGLARAH